MDIILRRDGRCIIRHESVVTEDGKLSLRFIGAPGYATLTVTSNGQAIRRTLSSEGETTIDVSPLNDTLQFTVFSNTQVWRCDPIRIVKDSNELR